MNAHVSPITSSDIENGPRDRLKAFEDLWEATFGSLADDRAYADCDTDLDRRFLAAKHAVENLVKGCGEHLDWVEEQEPPCMSREDWQPSLGYRQAGLGR